MSINKDELLQVVEDEVLALKASPLYNERVSNGAFPVIGEGSHEARIMFIGEAPGKNEAKTGRPFVGSAGKILDELLVSVGINRPDVYITSIVKDRPPLNRDPSPEEISIYGPFLDRQIDIIQPKVIATLGRFSMEYVMQKFGLEKEIKPISQLHGTSQTAETSYGSIMIIPLYHPAASIYNQHLKKILFEDFKILEQYI